jgi:hypothetical protein
MAARMASEYIRSSAASFIFHGFLLAAFFFFIYDGINNKRRQNSSCGSVLANNEEQAIGLAHALAIQKKYCNSSQYHSPERPSD